MVSIQAAGVTFSDSPFRGFLACEDCGGLVSAPDYPYGADPEDHRCYDYTG